MYHLALCPPVLEKQEFSAKYPPGYSISRPRATRTAGRTIKLVLPSEYRSAWRGPTWYKHEKRWNARIMVDGDRGRKFDFGRLPGYSGPVSCWESAACHP